MIRTECCGKTVSRTREDGRFAYFICWTCTVVQRIRLHLTPGAEGVNADLKNVTLSEKV